MERRLELHKKFCQILGSGNAYFQPPESVKLKYDCIIYNVSDRNDLKADDRRYRNLIEYDVTIIYRDPDSELPEKLMNAFTYITHSRSFTSDNLYHDVFRIYY